MPEPWPKLLANQAGERLMVATFEEQDAAARKGFYRNLGRIVERAEAEQAQKKAAP